MKPARADAQERQGFHGRSSLPRALSGALFLLFCCWLLKCSYLNESGSAAEHLQRAGVKQGRGGVACCLLPSGIDGTSASKALRIMAEKFRRALHQYTGPAR